MNYLDKLFLVGKTWFHVAVLELSSIHIDGGIAVVHNRLKMVLAATEQQAGRNGSERLVACVQCVFQTIPRWIVQGKTCVPVFAANDTKYVNNE